MTTKEQNLTITQTCIDNTLRDLQKLRDEIQMAHDNGFPRYYYDNTNDVVNRLRELATCGSFPCGGHSGWLFDIWASSRCMEEYALVSCLSFAIQAIELN